MTMPPDASDSDNGDDTAQHPHSAFGFTARKINGNFVCKLGLFRGVKEIAVDFKSI